MFIFSLAGLCFLEKRENGDNGPMTFWFTCSLLISIDHQAKLWTHSAISLQLENGTNISVALRDLL